MAEVRPFKGFLYNMSRLGIGSGDALVAPPYDIITPEYHEDLYAKGPYNIVRIDFGKDLPGDDAETNRYTRARASLADWIASGVLVQSPTPCFYFYEVEYRIGSDARKLRGVLGAVKLEEIGKGTIHPHEFTHSKPKKDRLDIMRFCDGNISPIYALYNSPERKTSRLLESMNSGEPYLTAADRDGSRHRLWVIDDPSAVETIRKEITGKHVFIADGHHRYETALEYQKEQRQKTGSDAPMACDHVLMFLANMADEGITILPTHRLAKKVPPDTLDLLADEFAVKKITGSFDILETIAGKRDTYGLYLGGESWYLLSYTGEGISGVASALNDLDVTVLHDLIFKQLLDIESVLYEMDVNECLKAVRSGKVEAAFFLNPTRVSDVEQVALASLRMPPKSTYFYPKLMTGMVLNIFNKP